MKICLILCGISCLLFYVCMMLFGKATVNNQETNSFFIKAALSVFATFIFFLIFCLPIIGITALVGFIIG